MRVPMEATPRSAGAVTRNDWIAATAITLGVSMAVACGTTASPSDQQPLDMMPTGQMPTPMLGGAGSMGMVPTPAGTAGSTAPNMMVPGPMAMDDEMMNTMPPPDEMEEAEPPPDPCAGFVVSRSKPCTTDPNPCNIDSGYPGDEYCLPPPAEGEGIQVHFGPSSYTDQAEVEKYLIHGGEEFNQYGLAHVPLTTDRFYNRVVYQMRPGSHHLINSLHEGQPEPGFQSALSGCPGATIGSLGGTQNLIYDSRPNGIVPPENEGLGYSLPGNSSVCFNYHRYNLSDADQLSEIWVNFYFIDEAEVTQRASWGAIIGGLGMSIPPGGHEELTYEHTFSGIDEASDNPARIIQLFGHRHAATDRFTAWLNDEMIYDSWNWMESVAFNYDSLTMNPMIDPEHMADGAVSGVVPVKNGDTIKYTCIINNKTENTLVFANELYTGEMCNLFGQAVGTRFFGTNF